MRKPLAFLEHFLSSLTRYSRGEQKGIVLLSLIAAGALCLITLQPRRPLDDKFLSETDRLSDSLRADYYQRNFSNRTVSASTSGFRPAPARNTSSSYTPKAEVFIELNSADSAALCTVKGIGPVISRNIVRYRNRLGGFVRIGQLREVYGITEENFASISKQFFIDTTGIQKIDINFASANSLGTHPYVSRSMADRIVRARNLKGGWNNLRELTDNDILLPEEAEKVALYVLFR